MQATAAGELLSSDTAIIRVQKLVGHHRHLRQVRSTGRRGAADKAQDTRPRTLAWRYQR